jgi:hypothetical protein
LEELKSEQQFNIYPNPVKAGNLLNIERSFVYNKNQVAIEIVDVARKIKLQRVYYNNSSIHIETNGFMPGIYFLRIRGGNTFQVK